MKALSNFHQIQENEVESLKTWLNEQEITIAKCNYKKLSINTKGEFKVYYYDNFSESDMCYLETDFYKAIERYNDIF